MNKQSLQAQYKSKYAHEKAKAAAATRVKGQQGRQLESLIDMTNLQYQNSGMADIRKIPTPVQIVKRTGQMVTGRLEKAQFVDYIGITSSAKSVIFDAKEVSVDRFDLKNLHQHQFDLLKSYHEKGACSFLVVCFLKRQHETYVLPYKLLEGAWDGYLGDGKKSIPYQYFVDNCNQVKSEKNYILHYLKAAGV